MKLPPADRLRLVEDIWDCLTASPEDVPVPGWHREELERRLADPNEQAALSWDEIRRKNRP
jgi:putative addiction module component (TIGR02574 family)